MKQLQIRYVSPADAAELMKLKWHLHDESKFLRLSSKERDESIESTAAQLERDSKGQSYLTWVVLRDREIVAYLSAEVDATGSRVSRITLGVRQDHRGLGIGTKLMKLLEEWARALHFTQIELNVMAHNEAALGLYRQLGFEIQSENSITLYDSAEVVQEYRMTKKIGCR